MRVFHARFPHIAQRSLNLPPRPHPQPLDEGIRSQLLEKFMQDRLRRLAEGDEHEVAKTFDECCPKYISTSQPNYDGESTHRAPTNLQRKLFLSELKQRESLPQIYSFLKMCTSIRLAAA